MSSAQINRVLADAATPPSEVRRALDIWVGARLQKLLPALITIYLAFSARSLVLATVEGSAIFGWPAYAISVVSIVSWMLLRRKLIAPNRVHLIAYAIGALILTHNLAEFYVTSNLTFVIVMMLVLIGSAGALLSWSGFALMASLSLAGWAATAPQKLSSASLFYWSLGLVATVAVAALRTRLCLQKHSQIEEKRLREENRKLQEQRTREHFELAVQGTDDGFWHWDLKSNIFQFTSSWEAMLGYERGELDTNPEEWFSRHFSRNH